MRFEEITITPELAKEWLATSAGNPRWRGKVVARYRVDAIKRDIMAGNWNPGNETIAFDERRRLIDGHHRLTAIAECGISARSWVCFGVSDLGQRHIDDNAVRTANQILKADMNAQGAIRDFMAGRSRKMRYQEKTAYYFDKMQR